ncbi:MAG: methyl-accepting chemotaxis protein [Pseudomonadota bacterium]
MLILGSVYVNNAWSGYSKALFYDNYTGYSTTISRIAHELQRERSISAGFIDSQGEHFQSALSAQRQATDRVVADARPTLEAFSFDHLPTDAAREAMERRQSLLAALNSLSAARAATDAMSPSPQIVSAYTNTITNALAGTRTKQALQSDQRMRELAAAYDALLWAKEYGARERAEGAAGFGRGFDLVAAQRIAALQARQASRFEAALRSATPSQRGAIEALRQDPRARAIDELRDIAAAGGDRQGVAPATWVETSTAYLDAIKSVEDMVAGDMLATAQKLQSSALLAFAIIVGAIATFLLAAGLVAARMVGRLLATLESSVEAIARIEAGADRVEVTGQERRDSFGVIARAVDRFAESFAAQRRIRIALDSSSALVMVADENHDIVFLNKPLQEMMTAAQPAIRADLPAFDAAALTGSNIDIFHKNPAHQRGMIDALTATHSAKLKLGGRAFILDVSPVFAPDGARLGTVVEWRDETATLRATDQIDAVVRAAIEGDFTKRAEVADAPEILREMGERLNTVAESVDSCIAETNGVLRAMAKGDLGRRVSGAFSGAFAELQSGVNETVERLDALVGEIGEASRSVRGGAARIAEGAASLADGATRQASSLQETAATMEEMSASIKANADSSASASALASEASSRAAAGGDVVRGAVSAMNDIEQSASKISDIITVIDGIAFQTNLLALNAAVEAARAGDAGKGFAVVASEVRALAQRASEAARDIRGLIETSASQVASGVALVTETGAALEGIRDGIASVEAAVSAIAQGSVEQATGAQEISATVNHMDGATQQNASLAEQSASHADALVTEAARLSELIAFFEQTGAAHGEDEARTAALSA